jgi:hypothetical protein
MSTSDTPVPTPERAAPARRPAAINFAPEGAETVGQRSRS